MIALDVLRLTSFTLDCALLAQRAHVPGDLPDDHEDNTYGLPEGAPLRKKLRAFFREQLKKTVGFVSSLGVDLPARFPPLADYNDPMASAMTPILGVYWDKAGKALNGRLGLDPDNWRVTDPNVHKAIARQSFTFCAATNATTHLKLEHALAELRRQFHEGLVDRGDTIPQLTRRVKEVFLNAATDRAELIARTEASRAVHTASEMSAIASGVVSAKRLLLSAFSCPLCVRVAAEAKSVALGGSFGTVGHHAEYSDIIMPPIHPRCRCSVEYILIDGPEPVPAFVPGKPAPEKPGTMEGSGGLAEGLSFVRTPSQARRKDVLVLADVARLDASLAETPGLHVGPGGSGESAIAGRYAEARAFLERAKAEGIPVHATEVTIGPDGRASIEDGRHRFAALRDSGATAVPVAVPKGQARRFAKRFGSPQKASV